MIFGIFVWTLQDLIGLIIIGAVIVTILCVFIYGFIVDLFNSIKRKFKRK